VIHIWIAHFRWIFNILDLTCVSLFFVSFPPFFWGENLQIEFLAAIASVALYIFTTQVPQAL
jgi:hypothetical protein